MRTIVVPSRGTVRTRAGSVQDRGWDEDRAGREGEEDEDEEED